MKLKTSGMVLMTTLCFLSMMACMWLSLMHALVLFRKVTDVLQQKQHLIYTLENELKNFVLKSSSSELESCVSELCHTVSGIVLRVKKRSCDPCLRKKTTPTLGTQYWEVEATLRDNILVIWWGTPALCGVCRSETMWLKASLLSWRLYP